MISFLSGLLAEKNEQYTIIDVGGVGFKVFIPVSTFRELPPRGEKCFLHTHLVVKEDEFILFGFNTEEEREIFQILMGVSGVGAKMAVDVVSHLPVDRLVHSVQNNESTYLCQVPGIGKKRAERILFDLKNTKHPLFLRHAISSVRREDKKLPSDDRITESVEAMIALGCKPNEAQRAVGKAIENLGENADVADIIREGLKHRSAV